MKITDLTCWRALGVAAIVCAGASAQAAVAEDADTLVFVTGDRLSGRVVAIEPRNDVTWSSPAIVGDTSFSYTNISRIVLGARETPPSKSLNACRLRLNNGDEFEGNLVLLDAEKLELDTWFAGRLTFARNRLDSLTPVVTRPSVVYEGPTGMDGWTVAQTPVPGAESNGWHYAHGAFTASASASIARDLKLPDVASIQFDIAWNGYMNVAIALYADRLLPIQLAAKEAAPDFGPFYSLQLQNNLANILAVKKDAPLASMGYAYINGLETRNSAQFTIRCNKAEKSIYLYLDGVLLKQWVDPVEFAGKGTCVRFVNQGTGQTRISNLIVSEWDGRMETPTNRVDNTTNDFVRLLNQDALAGAIIGFRDGQLTVKTSFAEVPVPLAKVAQAHFALKTREPIAAVPGTVRAQFSRRGQVNFTLERWENGKLVATSPSFGRANFDLGAFKTLELRPLESVGGL